MGFFRQVAFYLGLALGFVTVTVAGTVALTYLFTGKFPSVEMTEGKAELFDGSSGKHMEMQQGMSVIVPAAVTQYRIHGEGVVYKASVPLV